MTSTKSRTLATGDGNKTVYMQIKDNLGNISQEDISDTIILDTSVPTYSGARDQTLYSGNVSVEFADINIS
jgi:hypothetical protein